jgi:pyridine nucleotide-disulfide oxidoreductase
MRFEPRERTLRPMTTETLPRTARGGTLVLGGGFAGSYVARRLGRDGATIVNPTNYMLYTPLLPEAAAGSVEPRHVTVPLRAMCPHADLLLGAAVELDLERRVGRVQSDAGRFDVGYTDLVIALGSVTRMPAIPGLDAHSLGLKDLGDAIRLRNHVLRQVELADAAPADAGRRLTFVFAGAGFAGVEALAELQQLTSDALRRHPRLAAAEPRWILVDPAARILGEAPEGLARFAARTLAKRGIEIATDTALTRAAATAAMLSDGRWIQTETCSAPAPTPRLPLPRHREGVRPVVGEDLGDTSKRPRQPEYVLADVRQDQVRGDRRDLEQPGLAEFALDVVVAVEGIAAERLHRRVGRVPGGARSEQQRHVRLGPARLAGVEAPRRLEAHQVGRLDRDVGARQRKLDALVGTDRAAEQLALARRSHARSTNQRPLPTHSPAIRIRSAFMPSRM